MHALVDGHNAIFRLGLNGATPEDTRRLLLKRVLRVTSEATVFFDALGAPLLAPETAREGGLAVRFCRGVEADQVMLDVVRESARPSELLLVSDDRELAGRARQLGARTTSVGQFLGSAGDEEPPPRGPRAASRPADLRPFRAEDFGLPPVIDLRAPADWLEPLEAAPHVPRPVEAPPPAQGASSPSAPAAGAPGVALRPMPSDKARELAARLTAARPTRHLLLCAEATKPKCAPAEVGREVWEHLKRRARELGLDALKPPQGGTTGPCILRTKVDCLRVCADGPIAVVYPDGIWYHGVSVPVMERILLEHVLGGKPVLEHVLGRVPLTARG